jgi:hypothetical protein
MKIELNYGKNMKYTTTYCQKQGDFFGSWFYSPIDKRKKYYFCHICQGEHFLKEGLKKPEL